MVGEIYEMCKHNPVITGQQQIADAVCQYHKKGLLKRYRYGRKFKYFVPSVDNATQVTEQPVPSQVNVVASVSKDVSSKPEIIVNEDSIVINHAKCKITIEFQGQSMKMTLAEWCLKYDNGDFDSADFHDQVAAGWYDWFCSEKALARRLRMLAPKIKKIARSHKVNTTKVYVFLKNNCPLNGTLYDSFILCDIETNEVAWEITPALGHYMRRGRSEAWGKENNFVSPLVEGTWNDVLDFFKLEKRNDKN